MNMPNMTVAEALARFEVVEDRQIPHRAEEQGPRIGRVQTILDRVTQVRTTVNFWYQWETGKLLFVR